MSLTINKIVNRKSGRNHGEVFTNRNVIEFLLDEVGYTSNKDLSLIRILEPSSGVGAFAKEIIRRLYQSSTLYDFSFLDSLESNVRLIELDQERFCELKNEIQVYINSFTENFDTSKSQIFINNDFLLTSFNERFDCIVGNPPYIRNELIPSEKKKKYKEKFSTFKYRADLYIPFYEHSLSYLKEGGVLSFICSNRWLYNQYGKPLRQLISQEFHLDKIVNIEKSSPFDEDVIAYPCVTTISNNIDLNSTLFYESNEKEVDLDNLDYRNVDSPLNSSWEVLFLDYNLNSNHLSAILEQEFKIGIGVATGSDKTFILNKSMLNGIERNRLLPIVNTKDLTSIGIKWKGNYVINPFVNDELCDLNDYPHLKSYFLSHKEVLSKRYISKKTPEKWYKTIDKIKPNILSMPKLLIPDMNGGKKIILDEGNYYPHHNLYYITGSDIKSLKVLGAILMSSFIDDQISKIGICMNGGLARFQAQTLKKLKIPTISKLSKKDISNLISAFDNKSRNQIDLIIENYCDENEIKVNNKQLLIA